MSPFQSGVPLGDGFDLVRRLGQGSGGEVWLCRRQGELVVAKLAPPDAPPETLALLERECRLLRKLDHPHVVEVHGFHRTDQAAFIAMDYLAGPDLGSLRGAPPSRILEALLPIAEALEHVHSLGVVHRDVKLGNVRLDAQGRPFLLDFGIAGVLAQKPGEPRLVGGGSRHGVSPEQLAGQKPQPADDIYALGAMLYELLTGQPPLWPDLSPERILSSAPDEMVSPHDLPPRLRSLVRRLLAKKAAERPPSMLAVADELRTVLAELPSTTDAARPPAPLDKKAIRLTPPPRVVPPHGEPKAWPEAEPKVGLHGSPVARGAPGAGLVLLAVLALAAAGVFFYLPRWAELRRARPAETVTATSSAPTPGPAPGGRPAVEAADPSAASRREAPSEAEVAVEMAPEAGARPAPSAPERPEASRPKPGAAAARPGAPEVADVMIQLDHLERVQAIEQHSRRAQALEAQEEWRQAGLEHAAVLAKDATIAAAQEGQERCTGMARLHDELAAHIGHHERLSTPAVHEEARALVERAIAVRPAGPRLSRQIERLSALLTIAATPIRVELLSDGLTDIVVYRVGSLGRFERHNLDLLPGTYTVVGRRQGFRDVRHELRVVPGEAAQPLVVRCEDEV
jgi:hypothetical protein